jgi:thymidylate synthase
METGTRSIFEFKFEDFELVNYKLPCVKVQVSVKKQKLAKMRILS